MKTFPQELQAARLRLVKTHPYLASAAWALRPVAKPGLETLGVDMWWRLYYDPAVVLRWTVEALSGVLYHEICHLLRDHPGRMKNLEPRTANISTDAEINDDLIAEGICLPKGVITPATIGQPDGLLAEEYYAALGSRAQQFAPDQGASAQSGKQGETSASTGAVEPEAGDTQQGDGSEAGQEQQSGASADQDSDTAPQDTASDFAPGSGSEDGSDPSQTAQGGGQADDAHPGDQGDLSGEGAGDADDSQPGDGGGSSPSSSSGQPSDTSTSGQPGSSSGPSPGSGESHGQGQDGGEPGDRTQTPAPGAGRCGSCATGQPEPWEDGPPKNGDGIHQAEAEIIRRDVARQIKEHSKGRGNTPDHWGRWADEKLRPRVDWRKELAAAVRHAMADVAGAVDYSYRRPSRRQGQVGNGKVVLPSLRRPVPSVAVVVDTSGSMSDTMLAQALAEISGILRGLGQREGVTVLAVDTAVHVSKKVFDARQVQLAGGGGTDMREGIEAATKLRPQPQVCVVVTDGYTPWPDTPPRGMKTVVALVGDGDSPKWAKTVKIEEGK